MEKCFLKICPIFIFFFLLITTNAQTITSGPSVVTELNLYTDASVWVSAPAGQQVNARFGYFGIADTVFTSNLSTISLGVSHQFVVHNLVVSCDSLWNGFFQVWITGQEDTTIQSNNITWTLPCASEAVVGFSVQEIINTGVVISLDYNSGGVLAGLYWYTAVDGTPLGLQSISVFGTGTHTDTLFISAGQAYQVCYPEINNGIDVMFIEQCIEGEMDGFEPFQVVSSITVISMGSTIESELHISESGNINSEFSITVEQMLCDGTWVLYDEFNFIFIELVSDSTITLPILSDLPQSPSWRFTLVGDNGEFEIEQEVVVDLAFGLIPEVSIVLINQGNGFYNAVTTLNDMGAGNVVLLYYIDGEFVGQVFPTENTVIYEIPNQISVYLGGEVEVVLTSNACLQPIALAVVGDCGSNPTHILESAFSMTETSAMVQIAYADFHGCVQDAMVGVILVGVDTAWTPLSVNTDESSNYIIQLTGLTPNTTYVYLGVLYAEGEYFTTNFSLSFTTLSAEPTDPFFTNFNVNWDISMLITLFTYYDLGDATSVGLRVYHDGPNDPEGLILNIPVSNQFISFDYDVSGEYGTHLVWAELYDTETNIVYETTDVSVYTFQLPVSVTEFGQPVTRFDWVVVYDLMGRVVAEFPQGSILQPNLPQGLYIFQGKNKKEIISNTKIYLGQ